MTTLNIVKGHTYTTPITVTAGETLTVTGQGSLDSNVTDDGSMTINAKVIGGAYTVDGQSGTGAVNGKLTFASSVGANTEISFVVNSGAQVVIDHPREFEGVINNQPNWNAVTPAAYNVDLVGLANADAWTLNNDLLSITGPNGKVLDSVHLAAGSTTPGVYEDGGSTYLTWGYGAYEIPGFGTASFKGPLPEHTI